MAVAAIEAVKAAGLRVPENVAVTGFDNSRECDNSQVPLTTVAQPLRSMGEQAAQMLLDQLAGKIVADRTVPTQFIIRASCGGSATPAPHAPTPQPTDCLDMLPAPTIKTAIKQRNYLSHLQTDLNIKLMEKNTLAELKQELLQLLPRMSIQSCFLILYANPQQVFESPARLFMTYDESDPTLVNRFIDRQIDSDELLPEELLTDKRLGTMCELTPLVVGSDIYGYMLMAWNDHYFVDFLTLPIVISSALRNVYQLQSLKEYALELERKVEERTRELHLVNQHLVHEIQERRIGELALMAANEKLERLASIDELTQLKNRRMLDLFLLEQCQSQGGLAAPLSLLFADIDYFKKFNDTYGHQAGDDCLRAVADVFKAMAGQTGGMAARYGGEEFALVLPDCEHCEAIAIAKQLLTEVAELQIQNAASFIAAHVTLSIGITTAPPGISPTTEMLIAHADQALYRAKSNGRNCFACYHEPTRTLSSPSVFLSHMLTNRP